MRERHAERRVRQILEICKLCLWKKHDASCAAERENVGFRVNLVK
jgi:hypothetical protein